MRSSRPVSEGGGTASASVLARWRCKHFVWPRLMCCVPGTLARSPLGRSRRRLVPSRFLERRESMDREDRVPCLCSIPGRHKRVSTRRAAQEEVKPRTRRCHGSALRTRGVLRAQAPPGIACGARRSVHPTAPGAAGGGGSRNRRLAGAPRQNAGTQGGAAGPAVGVRLAGARRTALTGGVGCDWHAWHTALLSSGGAGCRQSVLRCMRPALRAA